MGAVVSVVTVVVLLATWVTWTATRIDRLHVRLDAARAALDARLVRRAAALQALVDRSVRALGLERAAQLRTVSRASLDADSAVREAAENDLSRALHELPADLDPALLADLADAARRVAFARRFYNDAVRDTLALRGRWLPRLLRLGGRRSLPAFFEIDDAVPPVARHAGAHPASARSGPPPGPSAASPPAEPAEPGTAPAERTAGRPGQWLGDRGPEPADEPADQLGGQPPRPVGPSPAGEGWGVPARPR